MKTIQVLLVMAMGWLALPASVWAFYNPSTGRWLTRDPIEERGGVALYAFVANKPISVFDPYGRCGCKCLGVDVTYEPGGDIMDPTWYHDPSDGRPMFGNTIHVVWHVEGDGKKCHYFQDETRLTMDTTFPDGHTAHTQGVSNESTQENYDDLGFYPNQNGEYLFNLHWDVTFRCISSDPSTPPVERHDGLWWFLIGISYPP